MDSFFNLFFASAPAENAAGRDSGVEEVPVDLLGSPDGGGCVVA
jgi:hypothetical protein